jgi:hypothetical protein
MCVEFLADIEASNDLTVWTFNTERW